MIITEKELTLFGGWAKAQIPLPIEIGVLKISDTASFSISSQLLRTRFGLFKNTSIHPILRSGELYWEEGSDPFPEKFSQSTGEQFATKTLKGFLQDNFKHLALVRYIEIWAESAGIDSGLFMRATKGTDKMKQSFNGMLGKLNGSAFEKIGGKWRVKDAPKLYPKIKRLPIEGIVRARNFAQELKRKDRA